MLYIILYHIISQFLHLFAKVFIEKKNFQLQDTNLILWQSSRYNDWECFMLPNSNITRMVYIFLLVGGMLKNFFFIVSTLHFSEFTWFTESYIYLIFKPLPVLIFNFS